MNSINEFLEIEIHDVSYDDDSGKKKINAVLIVLFPPQIYRSTYFPYNAESTKGHRLFNHPNSPSIQK